MDYNIICTGNPNKTGISKAVYEEFPNSTFIHLSNGYDLMSAEGQQKFKEMIKTFNVFINVSQLLDGVQEKLLVLAHEAGMIGHVFSIGSIAEYSRWEWNDFKYTEEKRSLRETSLDLCTEHFKTTHIVAGGFRDSSCDDLSRMDPKEIVNAIKYILNSKVHIPIIGIEKINDKTMEEQLKGRDDKL